MNKIQQSARKTKNFVSKHRVAIAVGLTLAVTGKMHTTQVAHMNEFLAKHNLLDEFYTPESE